MLGIIARDGFVNIEPSPADKNTNTETESLEDDYQSKNRFYSILVVCNKIVTDYILVFGGST